MKIFFTGSIRGGRGSQPQYAAIVRMLEKYGTVSGGHVSDETLSQFGETHITNKEILERELAAIQKCDVVVAEVTTPSHGVGYLIARATTLGKRVIALHFGEYELKLSGIIQGDQGVEIFSYKIEEDIKAVFEEKFAA